MKYKWLNLKQNDKLIVFFNGWGMDECVVKHLEPTDFDVLMFYDYTSLLFDENLIKRYKNKYLIAWSMGVMTATLFDIKYISKTAVNGTMKPIDNKFGIPAKIYDLTIKNFSDENAKKFILNMFDVDTKLPDLNRDFENLKQELVALKNYNANPNFKYDRIILCNNDKIIPTKNQAAFWGIEPNFKSGHCPFFNFKRWDELL